MKSRRYLRAYQKEKTTIKTKYELILNTMENKKEMRQWLNDFGLDHPLAVSYTHLTLPTT